MKRSLKEITSLVINNKRNMKEEMPHLCTEATKEHIIKLFHLTIIDMLV